MSRRSSGQRGKGRLPADAIVLDLSACVFVHAEAVERFVKEHESQPVLWIVARTGRRLVRDTLDLLQEDGLILRWREMWGRFQVWTTPPVDTARAIMASSSQT